MENHPIPQDVTGFKFRLIGSITVKQFLYLLGAGIIALLFYFFPIPFLIKLPFMLLAGGIGLSLAFVPIDGRPMDKMIFNFLRALPAENQYLYKKQGVEMPYFAFTPPVHAAAATVSSHDSAAVQKARLFNQMSQSYFKPDPEEQEKMASINTMFSEGKPVGQGFTNRVIKADEALPVAPSAVAKPSAEEPSMAQPHIPTSQPVTPVATPPKVEITAPVVPATNPTPQAAPQITAQPVAAPIPAVQPPTPSHGIDMANIIQGAVKDPRGKLVPHVIVEVLDEHNVPLRTFRTDQNGFFRAATPLPNGTYTLHMEDTLKKQEFEDKTITLTGTIFTPVEINSVDQREKLRRELFGVAHNTPQ